MKRYTLVVILFFLSSSAIGADARYLAPDPFDLQDRVRLNGDGTFEYEFKIVEDSSADENYASSFGDYKVVVSEYFGDGTTSFKVVEDPESFVDIRTPLGLKSDKSTYVLGSSLSLTGKVLDYHAPGGIGVRIDSHLYNGYIVPPHYDSLIAKLIVRANDREDARVRLIRALEEMVVSGIDTNLEMHIELLSDKNFISGDFDINYLETKLKNLN